MRQVLVAAAMLFLAVNCLDAQTITVEKVDGVAYAWGHNYDGEAGVGQTGVIGLTMVDLPRVVSAESAPSYGSIYSNYQNFSYFLTSDGVAYVAGSNFNGFMFGLFDGVYYPGSSTTPVEITTLGSTVRQITSCGSLSSKGGYALRSDPDDLQSWGVGNFTIGYNPWSYAPVMGLASYLPHAVYDASYFPIASAQMLATGEKHILMLMDDGKVWAWGWDQNGELGRPSDQIPLTLRREWNANSSIFHASRSPILVTGLQQGLQYFTMVQVAANGCHSAALRDTGVVYCWGENSEGQVGNNSRTDQTAPVQVSGLTDVTAIAAGGHHTLALKSNGTVYAWGDNSRGQIGDGTTSDRLTPVQVSNLTNVIALAAGRHHSLALKADGTVWAWGHNGNGEIAGYIGSYSSTPVQISGLSNVIGVFGKGRTNFAVVSLPDPTITWETDGAYTIDWVYQNTEITTADRHKTTLTFAFPGNIIPNTDYTVTITQTGGTGEFSVEDDPSDPLTKYLVGSRRTDGSENTGTAEFEVIIEGDVGGTVIITGLTLNVRRLGDVDGNGFVELTDKTALINKLNSIPVAMPDKAFDIDGNGAIEPTDLSILNNILDGIPIN